MNRTMVIVVVMMAAGTVAHAVSTLGFGDPTVEGNKVVIPVVLSGSDGVSALDFRLRYNPDVLQPLSASPGASAERADKRVMANVSSSGEYIVVVMGMNQTTCDSGEVVNVVMEKSGSSDADWGLGLAQQTLSGTDGKAVESAVLPFKGSHDRKTDTKRPSVNGEAPRDEAAGQTGAGADGAAHGNKASGQPLGSPQTGLNEALAKKGQVRDTINTPGAAGTENGSDTASGHSIDAKSGVNATVDERDKQDKEMSGSATAVASADGTSTVEREIAKDSTLGSLAAGTLSQVNRLGGRRLLSGTAVLVLVVASAAVFWVRRKRLG